MTDIDLLLQVLRRPDAPLWAVHYACESWFDVKDRPVAVSCIALVRVADRSEKVFSLTDAKDNVEVHLLERFFEHLKRHPEALLVHWNMHSSDFGFEALANRYRWLLKANPPASVPESNRFDLDELITRSFGEDYAAHPKLYTCGTLNSFPKRYLLSGKEEAEKFKAGEHGEIRRSTAEKAQLIAFLLNRLLKDNLLTKNSASNIRFCGGRLDAVRLVETLGDRFENVRRQLLLRHGNRPTIEVKDEYDFQDLLHSLLRIFFDDVRAEDWAPSYAGSASRIDFVMPEPRLAVELKHSRPSMSSKALGEELLVDAAKYGQHPGVETLVCLVMDRAGHINNPRGIEADLTRVHGALRVVVRIIAR